MDNYTLARTKDRIDRNPARGGRAKFNGYVDAIFVQGWVQKNTSRRKEAIQHGVRTETNLHLEGLIAKTWRLRFL